MVKFSKIKCQTRETAVALGSFNGIHKGHKEVIKKALEISLKNTSMNSVVFSVDKPNSLKIITDNERNKIISSMGIDILYDVPLFEIHNMGGENFVKEILVDRLNAKSLVCGFNYRFGNGAKCAVHDLKMICNETGIELTVIPAVMEDGEAISSTRIRQCIETGDILSAGKLIGRPFSITSKVCHGKKIGRKIGIPTMNQQIKKDLVRPKFGVYSSNAVIDGILYCSITNVGLKEDINNKACLVAETWVPKYRGDDVYGKKIKVELFDYIREEISFNNLELLKCQILIDAQKNETLFKERNNMQ